MVVSCPCCSILSSCFLKFEDMNLIVAVPVLSLNASFFYGRRHVGLLWKLVDDMSLVKGIKKV